MTAFASIISRSLSLIAAHIRVRPGLKKTFSQLYQSRSRCLVQGGVASGLCHVHVRTLGNQDAHRLQVAAQGDTCMQWLIAHRVAREAVYVCSVGKKQSRCLGSAKCSCQVKRSPAVS